MTPEVLAQPTAWLLGNEAHGLAGEVPPPPTIESRSRSAAAESINIAAAAAICPTKVPGAYAEAIAVLIAFGLAHGIR